MLTPYLRHHRRTILQQSRFFIQSNPNNYGEQGKLNKRDDKGYEQFDMRGNLNMDSLNQSQRKYSPLHSQQYNPFALYALSSKLSNWAAKIVAKSVESPQSQITSDALYLPKIQPESIPIYDILKSEYFIANRMWVELVPLSIFFFSQSPFLATFGALTGYFLYKMLYWSKAKKLALKIQLLPHRQQLVVLLMSSYGKLYTKRLRIEDVETVTIEDQDWINKKLFNEEMALKIKPSGEYILFDRDQGFWHQEGINHQLLN